MAEIQTQSDAFVKITGLKDAMMSAGVEHSHQLAPGSEPGIVCWTADGKEIFGRGGMITQTSTTLEVMQFSSNNLKDVQLPDDIVDLF